MITWRKIVGRATYPSRFTNRTTDRYCRYLSKSRKEKINETMSCNDTVVLHKMEGKLYSSVKEGLVLERHGDKLLVEDSVTRQLRECSQRNTLQKEHIACGDEVFYQLVKASDVEDYQPNGLVVGRETRSNLIYRSIDPHNKSTSKIKVIAANVDQLFVVVSPIPRVPLEAIDQLLAAGEINHMRSYLVINKCDMGGSARQLAKDLSFYSTLGDSGYPVLCVSAQTGEGMEELSHALRGSDIEDSRGPSSIFIGQSGVGKSSLINKLKRATDGNEPLAVGDLTRKGQFGAHTTTNTRYLRLQLRSKSGSGTKRDEVAVIDSPGIRDLYLKDVDPRVLRHAFPEIELAAQKCQFRNCCHDEKQMGCGVQQGIADGIIEQSRLRSYFHMVASCRRGR